MGTKDTFRIVTRGADGEIRIRDYDTQDALLKRHLQVGVDDCSTDLGLRGLPVFRGLIGPMPEGKNIIRYESPEVFETLTKEWGTFRPSRRRSRFAYDDVLRVAAGRPPGLNGDLCAGVALPGAGG